MKPFVSFVGTLLFCFLMTFASTLSSAQNARKHDLIIKRDSAKIEAIIQEVDESSVKYKKLTDPEGPTFSLLKSEIASIVYGNGEIEKFVSPKEQYFEEVAIPPVVPYKSEKPTISRPQKSADQLRANYALYLRKAKTYKSMSIVGGSVGILFTVIGIATISEAVRDYNNSQLSYSGYESKVTGGTLLTMTGLGAGIPLTIIGLVKKKRYTKRALQVQETLRQRNELSFRPGFNAVNRSAFISLKLKF